MKKIVNIAIWADTPVKIKHKCVHIHKIGGKVHKDFCVDYGDVPIGSMNEITGRFEPCQNTRGLAYAARKRLKYKSNMKKYDRHRKDWRR